MKRIVMLALLWSLLPMTSMSAEKIDATRLKANLARLFPELTKANVLPSPIKGMVALEFDGQVAYATEDGKYLLLGDIVDVNSRTNLSENARGKQVMKLLDEVGESNMIVIGPANAKRTLTVFTDVDCTYCARLHQDVPELNRNGVKVRYLLYPRGGIGSSTHKKSVAVWCADDRIKAVGIAKAGGQVDMKTCPNPVEQHYRLGERIGVSGTPTMYLDDGRKIGGYVPVAKLLPIIGVASVPQTAR
jgi:thiol:disulfide interchange protein DsbC